MLIILILCVNASVYAAYVLSAVDVKHTKANGTQTTLKAALDELYVKAATKTSPAHEIGDEVTVGGEQFYVLEWDNNCDTVNLISKYNLNTAGTAQDKNAKYNYETSCVFSDTNYWSNSFTSDPFILNDVSGYKDTDAIGKAKKYGISKGAISSRLLVYEEAVELKNKMDNNSKIKNMYIGCGNDYWLGAARDSTYFIWEVIGNTGAIETYFKDSSVASVRPVITVLKSKIE